MMSDVFPLILILSILFCSLVTGLVFGFAVVVMPGIAKLPDREFLLSFQKMDGIIQDNQPLFMLVWVGSIITIVTAIILGIENLDSDQNNILWLGSGLYLLGVQLPTAVFNIPLNNKLHHMDLMTSEESEIAPFRLHFETKWNRWNRIRTFNAIVSVTILLFLLTKL